MTKYIRKIFFLPILLMVGIAHAAVHEYETTHMKSMGGASVAGILAEESAFNNPAPLALFATSTVYAQTDNSALGKSTGFVVCDGNPQLSGSISYVHQKEDDFKRSRVGATMSVPTSNSSAAGISLRKTTDEVISSSTSINYYQTVLGVTHVVSDQLSIGLVAYDPFKSVAHETRGMIGLQYILLNYFTAAFDFGGNYNRDNISQYLIYKAAVQVTVLNDIYLRIGTFTDKEKNEKGTGMGLAWIQPRLSFMFAQKNFTTTTARQIKETSLAVSLRF